MKHKLDLKSLIFKTWAYFVLFTLVLVIIIWSLQVLFLNNFYESMKIRQTNTAIEALTTAHAEKRSPQFMERVEDLANDNDLYVYLINNDGKTMAFQPYDEVSGAGHYYDQIETLDKYLAKSDKKSVMLRIKGIDNTKEVLSYASYLQRQGRISYSVYLFSPLWPVNSTMRILTFQMIYVTLIALLFAGLLSLYLSRRITRPIRLIARSAERLGAGEYGIVFKGGHYTEINNLADTLTQTSIELEKSAASQKDLVANVSHDLKTPLTMIKSYAEMIRDLSGDNPVKREQHLQVIIDETDRLNSLVNDLLTVSKMQSNKIELDIHEFNLTKAAQSIVNTFAIREEDGYHVNFSCPSEFYVSGDEDRIKQVISNLIGNAIKFCGEDRTVNVSLKRRGFNKVFFSVEDNGVGIAEDELEHVWERYYKASSNMVRTTEGSGLGLSICKEILVLHKAEYGVDSTLGKGTMFWFELNLTQIDETPVAPQFTLVDGSFTVIEDKKEEQDDE
ncbi:MAG: HAMP domain-containing histidine kinase [Eubacterium sp.]|nr:HAMP domain-containing histidine kinase [Candidatus Colimonas fimequi]